MSKYLSQTELGKLYGVSSFQIGKWLVEAGLRDKKGKPTSEAFRLGIVATRPSTNPGTFFYVWSQGEVENLFHDLGYERPKSTLLTTKGGK